MAAVGGGGKPGGVTGGKPGGGGGAGGKPGGGGVTGGKPGGVKGGKPVVVAPEAAVNPVVAA